MSEMFTKEEILFLSIEESLQIALLWQSGELKSPGGVHVPVTCKADAIKNLVRTFENFGPETVQGYIGMLRACIKANYTMKRLKRKFEEEF